jgi:hypothetical protein
VVLNVSFGLPLFDTRVNEYVCEQIAAQRLFTAPALAKLMQSHRREALELLEFISRYQDLPVVLDPSLPQKSQHTPAPTSNLTFLDGDIVIG